MLNFYFSDILKLKSINSIVLEDLQKAYEKQEEMVEDVDSAGAENEEVAMESTWVNNYKLVFKICDFSCIYFVFVCVLIVHI